jgi:hypothetical protein
VSAYTAVPAPLIHSLLGKCERWVIPPAAGRAVRERYNV